MCTAMIVPEDAFFRHGEWRGDFFEFYCVDPREARQGEGIVLKLAAFDDKLAGKRLKGIVVLTYNDGRQSQSNLLTINCFLETHNDQAPEVRRRPIDQRWRPRWRR